MPAAVLQEAFQADKIEPLAVYCKSLRRRFIALEGFSGSGKSTLAQELSTRLEARLISIDGYLSTDPESIVNPSYLARVEQGKLRRAVSDAPIAVIEGILLRDVLAGIAGRADLVVVYLARLSQVGTTLIWHDGVRIEEGDGEVGGLDSLAQAELEYHRRTHPHEDADAIVLRIETTYPEGEQ